MTRHQIPPEDPARAAQWLLAEYDATDIEELADSIGAVQARRTICVLKTLLDGGSPMRVTALDYHDLYGQGMPLDDLYESKEQCRQDTAILHVHPAQYPGHIFFCVDPDDERWFRGNDRLHEKLSALGMPHEADLTTRAGGHSWDYFNHMAERVERFIVAGLEEQSRRLL